MTRNEFIATADSRETSPELMAAIWRVSGENADEAARVWDDPREAELTAVWEIVTQDGQWDAEDYCWGAAGFNWAAA